MRKTFLPSIIALVIGAVIGYFIAYKPFIRTALHIPQNKAIGFLPYWLAARAKKDYSDYLTGLSYFSLTINPDGTIEKLSNPQEEEPGWHALESGAMNPFFDTAKKNNETLALTIFDGDNDSIGELVNNPIAHADNFVADVNPIVKKYGFSDLNIDIEYVDVASKDAQTNFTQFMEETRKKLNSSTTLSIDVSPSAFIKQYLVDPVAVGRLVDSMTIMGYDYHYQNSAVTGPVAPLFGAGDVAEFDIQTAIQKALAIMPSSKIILGAPLYGYEWETVDDQPRSPVIPGTGLTASADRIKKLLDSCSTCSAKLDPIAQEKYIVYKDPSTGSYHQFFYPDAETMNDKLRFAQKNNLGGVALWALGYEDSSILNPLKSY